MVEGTPRASTAAATAIVARSRSGQRFRAIPHTAWATTATATIFKPWSQAAAPKMAERGDAAAEQDQRQCGRHGEPNPGGERPRYSSPRHPDDDADLAARRSRQELAQRDDIGVVRFVKPAAMLDELGAKEPEMSYRPAEGCEAEPRKDAQDFKRRTGVDGCLCRLFTYSAHHPPLH